MKDQVKVYLGNLANDFWHAVESSGKKPGDEIRDRLRMTLEVTRLDQATLFAKLSQVIDGLTQIQRYWTDAKGYHDDAIIVHTRSKVGGSVLISKLKPFVWTDNESELYPRNP